MNTEVIILGSGPAGYSAAIYLGRAAISHLLITGSTPGGQLTTTTTIENYPGFSMPIDGPKLMEEMADQSKKYGTEIIYDQITACDFNQDNLIKLINFEKKIYSAKSIIIATGASAKYLNIASEQLFIGYGISACATCDGFFYKNLDVLVIGGANSAVEEALYLSNIARSVTIIYRGSKLRAEAVLVNRLSRQKNVQVIYNHEIKEFIGELIPKKLTGVKIFNNQTFQEHIINCAGCFIAIGHLPNTDFLQNQIKLDKEGYIVLDYADSQKCSIEGVFAAGDVHDKIFRQAITAAGAGCKAALETINYLKNLN